MNLPYTMSPEMAADAVNMLDPGIVYPYHSGSTDLTEFEKLFAGKKRPEIRIRKLN